MARGKLNKMDPMQRIIKRLEAEPMTRIVALGSSNTAKGYHCAGQYNWFDWLDVGLSQQYGRAHHTINAGISGQTAAQCLARFDRDVALYQPHVVIVTVGGNDCNPVNNVSIEQFRADLTELTDRIEGLGNCVAVFQTYYSFDTDAMPPDELDRARQFPAYMQAVRDVAAAAGLPLFDHLRRWERLRKTDVGTYRKLMRDPMHLSPLGNMVFGLDDIRCFGAHVFDEIREACRKGLALQELMDRLEKTDARITYP